MACLLLPLSLYAQTDIDNEITVTDNDGNYYFAKTYQEHLKNCKAAGVAQ